MGPGRARRRDRLLRAARLALSGGGFPRLTWLRLLLGRPPAVAPQGEVRALDLRRYFRRKLQGDLEALPYNTDYVALVDALLAFLRRDPALKQLLADFERVEDRAALLEGLDAWLVENKLYREVTPPTVPEQVAREDRRLVCWEAVGIE